MLRVMYLGGVWSNAISYFNDEHTMIYGFKDRYKYPFSEGSVLFDIVYNEHNDTIPLYLITDIDFKDDPDDMFFANITLLGNVKNPKPKGDYEKDWYRPYIEPLLEEYKTRLKKCSIFKGKERRFLKMAVNILQLMKDE